MLYSFTNNQRHKTKLVCKACLFSGFLLFVLAGTLIFVLGSNGPMILGTEINTNGLIEYLCLGNGCESFTSMDF